MNWIVDNCEWLFSGVLVAVPITIIGWLFAKRRAQSASQSQGVRDGSAIVQGGTNEAGDTSTNIQAGSIVVNQGISINDARQVALDIFQANFLTLAGEARNIAQKRAEEITEDFLKKLLERHAPGLRQAQEPDFQHALFTVQKEYARCGDKVLGDLLVDLLIDRTKQPTRSLLQIVLNESLSVAPRLTEDQLAALSLVFFFTSTRPSSPVLTSNTLAGYLDHIASFVPLIKTTSSCYLHLAYAGCGTISFSHGLIPGLLLKTKAGLFCKGFGRSDCEAKGISIPYSHPIFIQCPNDSARLQVDALTPEEIRSKCGELDIANSDIAKLVELQSKNTMNAAEVSQHVITQRSYMQTVMDAWRNSLMKNLSLTSVGIAIGHANIKKNTGAVTDLSVWIN